MCKVTPPLKWQVWQDVLRDYPDQAITDYIHVLRGIETGFKIGFDTGLVRLQSKRGNLPSTTGQPDIIGKYLPADRVVRLHHSESKELGIQCSPFGVFPKRHRPKKWRLIVDLSAPHGHSVNDGVLKELSALSYISVDKVVAGILQQGRGTLMAKMDICHAYSCSPK